MNRITIGQYEFTDETILENPQKFISNSMLADALEIDTLEFSVYSLASGVMYIITDDGYTFATSGDEPYVVDEGYLINLPYGTEVCVYKDDVLRAKFFLQSVQRTGLTSFKVKAISAIGRLDKIMHDGGIYNAEPLGNILAELMGTIPYTVDNEVAQVECYGWLPRASARENLIQLMFSCGASVLKGEDGTIVIRYNGQTTPLEIPNSNVYIGGTVDNPQTVTKISLIEHSFVAATDNVEEVLFDNVGEVAVSGARIYFDEPMHSLRASGITLVSSGANYAELTGTGTLYGKKYTHSQREIVENINPNSEPNEINIKDATLVGALNSNNVMARLKSYYESADIVSVGLINDSGIKTGDYLTLTDPFGEQFDGIVQEMDETISAIDKANTKLVRNWVPSNFGNNYSHYMIKSGYSRFNFPTGYTHARVILIGGGQGGQSGGNGYTADNPQTGGAGGLAGQGGEGGRVFIQDITFADGALFSYNTGMGSLGGTQPDRTAGADPVDAATDTSQQETTLTVAGLPEMSSMDGSVLPNGITNTFTGQLYATSGLSGYAGGDGAGYNPDVSQTSLSIGSQTWYSGTNGDNTSTNSPAGWLNANGGRGGGAAYGHDGGAGVDGATNYYIVYNAQNEKCYELDGGNGGNGADADPLPTPTIFPAGQGGLGGNGGGGAGAGGRGDKAGDYIDFYNGGNLGSVGKGSNGGRGAYGIVLIYY